MDGDVRDSDDWLPAEYRDKQASREHEYPKADLYPVPDRRGISLSNHLRPVDEQPVYEIVIEVRDFSIREAVPQLAAAIDAQIDGDDARDDFIKEKLHRPSVQVPTCIGNTRIECGRICCWFNCRNDHGAGVGVRPTMSMPPANVPATLNGPIRKIGVVCMVWCTYRGGMNRPRFGRIW